MITGQEIFDNYNKIVELYNKFYELEKENVQLQQKWLDSEYEKSKLVSQIKKMKCCRNCKYWNVPDDIFNTPCEECTVCKDFNKWEVAE